jgi:heterotetrameric sarcosine oxidase gamma subunit
MNVTELDNFTLLHVATRGEVNAAASALSTQLGIAVGTRPGDVATREGGTTVLWSGPGRWLVHAPVPAFRLEPIDGCAITDLSDSRRIFRLSGDDVRDHLAASCPLDLSDAVMPVDSCALSQFDRFSIFIYHQAAETFDIYVERSYAPSLRLPAG